MTTLGRSGSRTPADGNPDPLERPLHHRVPTPVGGGAERQRRNAAIYRRLEAARPKTSRPPCSDETRGSVEGSARRMVAITSLSPRASPSVRSLPPRQGARSCAGDRPTASTCVATARACPIGAVGLEFAREARQRAPAGGHSAGGGIPPNGLRPDSTRATRRSDMTISACEAALGLGSRAPLILVAFRRARPRAHAGDRAQGGASGAEEGRNFFANAWAEPPPAGAVHVLWRLPEPRRERRDAGRARWIMPAAARAIPDHRRRTRLPIAAAAAAADRTRTRGSDGCAPASPACSCCCSCRGTEEIWLQTLHCQFELTLWCGIILALDPAAGRAAVGRLAVLALAPLCGPGRDRAGAVCSLARSAFERSGGAPAAGTDPGGRERRAVPDVRRAVSPAGRIACGPAILLCVWSRSVTSSSRLFGLKVAYPWRATTSGATWRPATRRSGRCCLPGAGVRPRSPVLLWRNPARGGRRAGCWRPPGLTGLAAYYGAIGGADILIGAQSGERYVLRAAGAARSRHPWPWRRPRRGTTARVASIVVVWLIVVGRRDVRRDAPGHAERPPPGAARCASGNATRPHVLRIWPDGWTVTLPAPACSRPACSRPVPLAPPSRARPGDDRRAAVASSMAAQAPRPPREMRAISPPSRLTRQGQQGRR